MSQENLSQEQAIQAVYNYAAGLIKSGKSARHVEARLVEKGLDPKSAAVVVKKLFEIRSKAMQAAGQKNMLYGALWAIGGIVVTVGTLSLAASNGGGSYVVAWGAIIFGIIQFFRGMIQYFS